VQISAALFARDIDFARPGGICMFGGVGNKLIDEETKRIR